MGSKARRLDQFEVGSPVYIGSSTDLNPVPDRPTLRPAEFRDGFPFLELSVVSSTLVQLPWLFKPSEVVPCASYHDDAC